MTKTNEKDHVISMLSGFSGEKPTKSRVIRFIDCHAAHL